MRVFKALFVAIGVIAIGAVVVVGGYNLGWWLREDATNRSAEIRNDSFARQSALQAELIDLNRDIANINVQITTANPDQARVLGAQRQAIVVQFCDAYGQITDSVNIPQSVISLATQECS